MMSGRIQNTHVSRLYSYRFHFNDTTDFKPGIHMRESKCKSALQHITVHYIKSACLQCELATNVLGNSIDVQQGLSSTENKTSQRNKKPVQRTLTLVTMDIYGIRTNVKNKTSIISNFTLASTNLLHEVESLTILNMNIETGSQYD